MKAHDIDKLFTEKVSEYIAKGYILHPATMCGHQGEIGRVDLTNGEEVLRILLDRDHDFETNLSTVTLTVGRNTDEIRSNRPYDSFSTIWNGHLEVIEEHKFYQMRDNDYFVEDAEVAKAASEKRISRITSPNNKYVKNYTELGDSAKQIARKYLQRTLGIKKPHLDKIKVEKKSSKKTNQYTIAYNGRSYTLARS